MKTRNAFLLSCFLGILSPIIQNSLINIGLNHRETPVSQSEVSTKKSTLPMNAILEVWKNGKKYQWTSEYVDTNKNGLIDKGDAGFFPPASTVKVAIAALAVEKNNGINGIENDLKLALVVSDNKAANRLIDKAGGLQAITNELKLRGFDHFVLSRKFGVSPFGDGVCIEGDGSGNCASAADLIRSVQGILGGSTFNLSRSDREFLQKIMTLTPKQIGIKKRDNYCRFLPGATLEKCGVSIDSKTYSSVGVIDDAIVVIAVSPDGNVSEREKIKTIKQIVSDKLKEIQ